jgi:hypothetical protein
VEVCRWLVALRSADAGELRPLTDLLA